MSPQEKNAYRNEFSDQKIISALEGHITPARLQRIEQVIAARLTGVTLAIEAPSDLHNVYAALRSCEVFGLTQVYIISPDRQLGTIRAISKGAFYWMDIDQFESWSAFITFFRNTDRVLAGAVLHAENPRTLEAVPIEKPLCLVFGNEHRGLSEAAIRDCDVLFQIPMQGMTESLNLSVACGIALYETCKRKRASLPSQGDLTAEQALRLRAQFYLNSVNPKLIGPLLRREGGF